LGLLGISMEGLAPSVIGVALIVAWIVDIILGAIGGAIGSLVTGGRV